MADYGIPNPSTPIVDNAGFISRYWYQFFNNLIPTNPLPESAITVTASPFTYTLPSNGYVVINGGTVSAINVKRINSYVTGLTGGVIALSRGDSVVVTYTVAPTMTFMPQ